MAKTQRVPEARRRRRLGAYGPVVRPPADVSLRRSQPLGRWASTGERGGTDAGTVVRAEPYLALATSEGVGRAVVSGHSREALADLDGDAGLRIGNVEPVMEALTAGVSGVPLVSSLADGLVDEVAGDPRLATTRNVRGLVLDGDRLARHVEAVAAAAEAFETATR